MQVMELCQYFSCDSFMTLKANVSEAFDFEPALTEALNSMGYEADSFRGNIIELNKARSRAVESSQRDFPYKKIFEYIFQVEDVAFRLAEYAPFENSIFRW